MVLLYQEEGMNTIFSGPASGKREAIVNGDNNLHDVTIRDLVIECGLKTVPPSDPNSISYYLQRWLQSWWYSFSGLLKTVRLFKNINLLNITVQNGTYNGVYITGASNVNIQGCDFNENEVSVPPGQKLLHNLLLTYCKKVKVKDCRLVTSPYASGVALDNCSDVSIFNSEIARNGYYGLLITGSKNVTATNNLIEGNDRTGVMIEFLQNGSENIDISNNTIQYNSGYAVSAYRPKKVRS